MDYQFKRLLDLVRRTGDRLVVTDSNGEETYVLMGLEAYENLADRLPTVEPEPLAHRSFGEGGWDKPHDFKDGFLDDYYDEDEDFDNEEFEDKPKWEVPDELLPNTVGVSGLSAEALAKADSLSTNVNDVEPQHIAVNDRIVADEPSSKDIWKVMPPAGDKSETWNPEKFSEGEKKVVEEKFENPNFLPKSDKKDDEPGEEQFYLEPVE